MTSYEILNYLVSNDKYPIPFFTEFSRDRQARVFSHILVREVDRSFKSVNSDAVIDEVKEGRIIIVLDGFDELLHDSSSDSNSNDEEGFENAEPMLETISELLTNKAKVILTSRRSAIFDGEMFNEWVNKYSDQFTINRYKLDTPNIQDWIPSHRLNMLEKTSIRINDLANPVLLSFLRSVGDPFFNKLCKNPSLIVKKYLDSMLSREMKRQELRMNVEEQSEFLKIIATEMCEKNYTSISKEKFINVIKEKTMPLLNKVRYLYSPQERPTVDKLATTLSNHAFFDRTNQGENNIGFVNEFVFGNYIGQSVIDYSGNWMASDERFIEPAVNSYVARGSNKRKLLWDKLSPMSEFLEPSTRMRFESLLTAEIKDSTYNNLDISSINIRQIDIFKIGGIENSIFRNCIFKNCIFYIMNFNEITFLNCTFWDCNFNHENDTESNINFYNCNDNNNFVESIENLRVEDKTSSKHDVEFCILSKIWPVGHTTLQRLHYFTSNLFKIDKYSKKDIIKGIKSLKNKGIFEDANDTNFIAINKHKITDIKIILGMAI